MNQRERINELMKKHNINKDKDLLIKIFKHLGKTNTYDLAEKGKSNFSKMLNGERKFNNDYIIPLESILETSLNYIINGDKFNPNFDNFGIKYVAFLNKYDSFEKLDQQADEHYNPLFNCDEFGKNIVDYIIQYESINGLRYLSDKYNIKYNPLHNCVSAKQLFVYDKKIEQIMNLICKNDDAALFNSIFDGLYNIEHFQYYDKDRCLYFKDVFYKTVSETTSILEKLFIEKKIKLNHSNETYLFTNPLINKILDFMLTNSQDYKAQILKVLKLAKNFNQKQLDLFQKEYGLNLTLEIDTNGFIVNNGLLYGNIIIIPEIFNPKTSQEIITLIEDIQKINKKITIKETYDFWGRKIYKTDENYIYKKHSNNVTEYELYKDFKDSDLQGILKYHSTEFDIDKFIKVDGTQEINSYMINEAKLKNLSRFLKNFHSKCKLLLNGKVYINNNLISENILFNKDEVVAIIDWSLCEISDCGLNDLLFLITKWSDITNKCRDNTKTLANIKLMYNEYFENAKCENFGSIFEQYLLSQKKTLSKESSEYEAISWALVFVDIYKEKLNQL